MQINGFISDAFTVKRGFRQGDPISPYIFILCFEILSIKIRQSKSIKGIKVKDTEYLISQFADDTTLLLDGSEKSLNSVLEILDRFYTISALKCNFDKPKLIWIASRKYRAYSIKTKWKLNLG